MTDETTLPPDDQAPPPSETPPTPDTPTTGEPASTPEPGTTTPETPPPPARAKASRASTRAGKPKTPAKSKPAAKGKATPSPKPPQASRCLARTMATDDAGTATECACELAQGHDSPHTCAVTTNAGTILVRWGDGQADPVRIAGTITPRADVTVVDLDDIKEKALNMALNNPEIAGEFTEKAEDILKEIEAADADLYASIRLDALDDLIGGGGNDGAEDEELIDVKVQALPSMTWVLIGIPTVRFGEVAHVVEAVTTVPDVICEVTANGG